MTRSANEVMQDVIAAAVLDAIDALKKGAGGLPNALVRDIGAIHANTAFADLPEALRQSIGESVRGSLSRLLREGYAVAPARPEAARVRPPQGVVVPRGERGRPPRPPRPGGPGRGGPRGPRPGGGPKGRG